MRTALIALLLAPSVLLGAEATPSAAVKVGTGIESKDVTGEAAELKVAPDTNVYLWTKVSGLPADAKVKLAFEKADRKAWEREKTLAGSPYYMQDITKGIIIILSVALTSWQTKRSAR